MKFADMTDKELMDMAISLHNSIYVIQCYGCKDMVNLLGAEKELDRRGIEVTEEKELVFTKDGEVIA